MNSIIFKDSLISYLNLQKTNLQWNDSEKYKAHIYRYTCDTEVPRHCYLMNCDKNFHNNGYITVILPYKTALCSPEISGSAESLYKLLDYITKMYGFQPDPCKYPFIPCPKGTFS